LTGSLLSRRELAPADEEAMYGLFNRQFTGVSQRQFRADLDDKNWIMLLRDRGRLAGFSTLLFYDALHDVERVSVVCSGDTVVDRSAWSAASALSCYWIGAVNHLRRAYGKDRIYWLLIVSGYRTYRFLPVYWLRFDPCHNAPIPAATQHLMHALAAERFGDCYVPEEGVVRFPEPQALRDELRGIPEGRLSDPHVAFFAARNPGHENGDELVCLTELSYDNLTPAGRRMWAKGDRLFSKMVEAA
jgi:hypothetical protein